MINSVSLWHVTPVDLGVEFLDPTNTALLADESLFLLVNNPHLQLRKAAYSRNDYDAIMKMRSFLLEVRRRIEKDGEVRFYDKFPNIPGCIAVYQVTDRMGCYIMINGIAVFFEKGEPIPFDDEAFFSIPTFYERQVYEDDYCYNPEETARKLPLYQFLRLLWKCVDTKEYSYSASDKFRNHGVSYTLCITMVDIPDLLSNQVDMQLRKNCRALLDTSPFNNIYNKDQWDLIRQRIDNDEVSDLNLRAISENLVFADSWAGVLLAGDLSKNETCITWLMEFEIYLQAQWFLFDAYCENIVRMDMSTVELQSILNKVEFTKAKLDNDISSNMTQSCHTMRNSLIKSSEINTIYEQMHSMTENRLKMKLVGDEQKRSRFALLSDLSLLLIALLEVYDVVKELLAQESLGHDDIITMLVLVSVGFACAWIMVKGKL